MIIKYEPVILLYVKYWYGLMQLIGNVCMHNNIYKMKNMKGTVQLLKKAHKIKNVMS
jgi:hypothetical protein